jgi:hypothetical protein
MKFSALAGSSGSRSCCRPNSAVGVSTWVGAFGRAGNHFTHRTPQSGEKWGRRPFSNLAFGRKPRDSTSLNRSEGGERTHANKSHDDRMHIPATESEIAAFMRTACREDILRCLPHFTDLLNGTYYTNPVSETGTNGPDLGPSNQNAISDESTAYIWTPTDITAVLYGLRSCYMHDKDVHAFLVSLAKKFAFLSKLQHPSGHQFSGNKFTTIQLALSLIGLQHLNTQSKAVSLMLHHLATNYETVPSQRPNLSAVLVALQSLSTKHKNVAVGGTNLQGISVNTGDTDRLVYLLADELKMNREIMTSSDFAVVFQVLKNMSDKYSNPHLIQSAVSHPRSRSSVDMRGFQNPLRYLLAVVTSKLEVCKRKLIGLTPQRLSIMLNSLQFIGSEVPELRHVLKVLAPYIPIAHCSSTSRPRQTSVVGAHPGLNGFSNYEIAAALYGLGNCSGDVAEVREVLKMFTDILADRRKHLVASTTPCDDDDAAVSTRNCMCDGCASHKSTNPAMWNPDDVGLVFLGLRHMNSDRKEVRQFLSEFIELLGHESAVKKALRRLPRSQQASMNTQEAAVNASERVVKPRVLLNGESEFGTISLFSRSVMVGLQNMRSNNPSVREVLRFMGDQVQEFGVYSKPGSFVHVKIVKHSEYLENGGEGRLEDRKHPAKAEESAIPVTSAGNRAFLTPHECAWVLYGFQGFSSSHPAVLHLLSQLLPYFPLRSSSDESVRPVDHDMWTPSQIAMALWGLRRMSNEHACVREVLNMLSYKMDQQLQFGARDIALAMYGLNGMNAVVKSQPSVSPTMDPIQHTGWEPVSCGLYNGSNSVTRLRNRAIMAEIIDKLAVKMMLCKEIFTPSDIALCLYGLRSCSNGTNSVRRLLTALSRKIKESARHFPSSSLGSEDKYQLNGLYLGLSLYGMNMLSSEEEEVLHVLRALTGLIRKAQYLHSGTLSSQLTNFGATDNTDPKAKARAYYLSIENMNASVSLSAKRDSNSSLQANTNGSVPDVFDNTSSSAHSNTEMNGHIAPFRLSSQQVSNCLYGLRNMSSRSFEVKELLVKLNTLIDTCNDSFSNEEISMSVYGLQRMNSQVGPVRALLKRLRGKFENVDVQQRDITINSQCVGNFLFGMQNMSTDHAEVVALLEWLECKIHSQTQAAATVARRTKHDGDDFVNGDFHSLSPDAFAPQHIANAIFGMQKMSSEVPVVRRLLDYFASILPTQLPRMNKQELSNCLYGLQKMSVAHSEVRLVLQLIRNELETAQHDITRQSLAKTLAYLPSEMMATEEIQSLLAVFTEEDVEGQIALASIGSQSQQLYAFKKKSDLLVADAMSDKI